MKRIGLTTTSDASDILWCMNHRLVWKLMETLDFPYYENRGRKWFNHADVLWVADRLLSYSNGKSGPNGSNWSNRAASNWMRQINQQKAA